MRSAAAAVVIGCLSAPAVALAQSAASFSDAPSAEAEQPPEGGGEIDAEGRELRPYVRPPYTPPEEKVRRSRASRRRQSIYHHDGFYLRFAAGLGGGVNRLEGSYLGYDFPYEDGRAGRMYSFAVPNEVAMGYTVAPGVVTGAGIYNSVWTAPVADAATSRDYEFETTQLALFGPMLDVYPWPRDGWHLQGSLALASFNMGFGTTGFAEPRPAQAHVAVGFGFMLGGGYEWFVAEQWSVGFLLRTMRGWSGGTDGDAGNWTHRSASYGLLLTVTRH
jgi:hypothetical protein